MISMLALIMVIFPCLSQLLHEQPALSDLHHLKWELHAFHILLIKKHRVFMQVVERLLWQKI